jgi:hypothetical protein
MMVDIASSSSTDWLICNAPYLESDWYLKYLLKAQHHCEELPMLRLEFSEFVVDEGDLLRC